MNDAERKQLLDEYDRTKSPRLREQIIIEYAQLVKLVAGRLSMYLGYNVEYDDLVSYGIFGLIDAIDKFDYQGDVKFETYASLRIRGAILDHVRKLDWIPRTIRQRQKKVNMVVKALEQAKGRTPTDDEVAQAMGISLEEYLDIQNQMKVSGLISLNEYMEQGSDVSQDTMQSTASRIDGPEESYEKKELAQALSKAMELLTDKEQKVITLYYFEELTLKEISNVLDVSVSRVSQLHTRALQKMREQMGDYMGILFKV